MTAQEITDTLARISEQLDALYPHVVAGKFSEKDFVQIKLEAANVIYEARFIQREAEMQAPIASEVR